VAARRRKKLAAPRPARKRGHRLDSHLRPTDVDVELEVDPAAGEKFAGEVRHHLRLDRPARAIELHAADLRVSRPRLTVDGRTLRGRLERRPDRETVAVLFDKPVPAGEATLELAFAGKLRSDLRGLYAARSGQRKYAFTQLEAADARRFFPCFDEPAMKACFALSVTTASGHTVLSNQPAEKVEPLGGGRKRVSFSRTPPLSTYLLALGVGELEASEPTYCGETEIRVWHVPGKGHLAAFGLEAGRECLARLEAWFDLPYPYEKLDLVAVPDFEAGAMENAGAVFFRETLLLTDPATVTVQERKRVSEVVCHELAHMWYGDLVTMAWWDDLWLNEAFATWMAFHIVDRWKPEWKMWHDFQHYRSAALGLDSLTHTHPIYTKVQTPSDATENFDLITYEKGASVVRMLERYLGAGVFRTGVRRYIRRHRESNAVAADLWSALSEASGQDVESVARAWVEQEGFPIVQVQRIEQDGRPALALRQERFLASPKSRRSERSKAARWPIPWVGRLGGPGRRTRTERRLLTRRREVIPLEGASPTFVYANADEGGFFRPLHDDAELARLAAERAALPAVERMGLIGHHWAAVRAGRAELPGFLDLALAFGRERDPDVLATLRGPLAFVAERIAQDSCQPATRGHIARAFGPAFTQLGWDPADGEPEETRLRRAALLGLVGSVADDPAVAAEAPSRLARYLADRASLDPNLADGVVSLAARTGDAALRERLRKAAAKAATPQERRRLLMALADFRDPKLIERTLDMVLGDEVGTQDVALLLVRLFGNPAAREATWTFLKRRWPTLRRRLPPMLVTRPIEATPALGTRAHRRDVAAFFRANPVATGARAVRQALERFDHDLELAERAAPQLERWLASQG
jgi:puromycin-sensitive aminopeptidase